MLFGVWMVCRAEEVSSRGLLSRGNPSRDNPGTCNFAFPQTTPPGRGTDFLSTYIIGGLCRGGLEQLLVPTLAQPRKLLLLSH